MIQYDTEKNTKIQDNTKNTVVFIQQKRRSGPASPVESAGRLFKVGQELAEESDGKT